MGGPFLSRLFLLSFDFSVAALGHEKGGTSVRVCSQLYYPAVEELLCFYLQDQNFTVAAMRRGRNSYLVSILSAIGKRWRRGFFLKDWSVFEEGRG